NVKSQPSDSPLAQKDPWHQCNEERYGITGFGEVDSLPRPRWSAGFLGLLLRHDGGAAIGPSDRFPLRCFGLALLEQGLVLLGHGMVDAALLRRSEDPAQLAGGPHERVDAGLLLGHVRDPSSGARWTPRAYESIIGDEQLVH